MWMKMYYKTIYEDYERDGFMKHISAYMGDSKKHYEQRRAWFPFKSTSGEWILPLQKYYVAVRIWKNAIANDGEIKNKRYLTVGEFILESFTQKST